MRQIGAGEEEGDYGFTTTEERKVDNGKALIRKSYGICWIFLYCSDKRKILFR